LGKRLTKIKPGLLAAWKWIKFSGWLVWFFLTFPWQIKKGYSQFVNAISLGTSAARKKTIQIDIDVSPRYYGNLN
jgi:hypothetical protein